MDIFPIRRTAKVYLRGTLSRLPATIAKYQSLNDGGVT